MMTVGIPLENKTDEKRVALIPSDCKFLVENGCKVLIENNAGKASGFENNRYVEAGVQIINDAENFYKSVDLIVKVKEPQPAEISMLTSKHTLFCFLHLGGNPILCDTLLELGLRAYAFETVHVNGQTPLLAPMSKIAGHLAVLMGSNFITSTHHGKGILLGNNFLHHPGKMLILGAGMAGQSAINIARSMGIELYVIDSNEEKLQNIELQFPGISVIAGSKENISKILPEIDVLIGAVYVYAKTAPKIITRKMVQLMSAGSVILDISIDQGGCVETIQPTTHSSPTYTLDNVVHCGITNLPAAVPRSASIALSNQIVPYVLELAQQKISSSLKSGLNIMGHDLMIDL